MVVSLTRMLKSWTQSQQDDDPASVNSSANHQSIAEELPPIHYPSSQINDQPDGQMDSDTATQQQQAIQNQARQDQACRAERVTEALAQVNNTQAPTPLTDRYLANKAHIRPKNRPPFDPDTLWFLKHGRCPIMTELIHIVDDQTLNTMPIEAVAILDRINDKLKRYRQWSQELNDNHEEWICEKQFVIDKLINESIPEALSHYEQLLRFSPYRTKNSKVQGNMTAGDMLTDLFLEIDYELDELLDELHQIVLNRLASTHRYVKSRTQS